MQINDLRRLMSNSGGQSNSPGISSASSKQALQTGCGSPAGSPATRPFEIPMRRLAERLKAEPNNAEGWRMLARSHAALGRYADAVAALRKLDELQPDNPDTLCAVNVLRSDALDLMALIVTTALMGVLRSSSQCRL
jgi:hypothetical protein